MAPLTRVAVPLVLSLSFLPGCRSSDGRAEAGPPPTPVQAAQVEPTEVQDASEYVASVQSLASTDIKPEVSGVLTQIAAKSGDRVKQGSPLFVIDPRRQEATVRTESASLQAQEAASTFAAQQLARSQELYAQHAVSLQELQQAQANADSAARQLEAQRAKVQQERVTLQYYQVRAPVAGVVGDIPVRVGAHVTSDTTLTSIDRNARLEIHVPIPLQRAQEVRMGLPIEVLDGQGRPVARTEVSFISPAVDEQTQSVLVKGQLPDDTVLRASQFVRARVVWRTAPGLTVPVLSVTRINGQPFVFVLKNEQGRVVAEQRLVRLGEIVGNNVVVDGGLAAGERVVVSGVQKLHNGAPVLVT